LREGASRAAKTFTESELEMPGVHHEPGKAAYALMARDGEYVGAADIPFPKLIRERFHKQVEANLGPKPPDAPDKHPAVWPKPGTIGRVRHLRGADKLRHAQLIEFRKRYPRTGLLVLCFQRMTHAAPRPSLPGLTRQSILPKDVDARDKPGHDGGGDYPLESAH
jgi:hypothetical protein